MSYTYVFNLTTASLVSAECAISNNGQDCGCAPNYESECPDFWPVQFEWDCDGRASNVCDTEGYLYDVFPIIDKGCFGYLPWGGSYCTVCPDPDDIQEDVMVTIPGLGEYNCSVAYAAFKGAYVGASNPACPAYQAALSPCCGIEATNPPCNICAVGKVTDPDGNVPVPGQPNRTCAMLQGAGDAGLISEAECTALQAFTEVPCACDSARPLTTMVGLVGVTVSSMLVLTVSTFLDVMG
jgi:hypothetical protein